MNPCFIQAWRTTFTPRLIIKKCFTLAMYCTPVGLVSLKISPSMWFQMTKVCLTITRNVNTAAMYNLRLSQPFDINAQHCETTSASIHELTVKFIRIGNKVVRVGRQRCKVFTNDGTRLLIALWLGRGVGTLIWTTAKFGHVNSSLGSCCF